MLQWLVHGYHTRHARLLVMGLVHRNEFIVKTWKYQMVHVIIIRLAHMNIVIVTKCEYMFVVAH